MTQRIYSRIKSRTTDRASWGYWSCAYFSVCSNIIHILVEAIACVSYLFYSSAGSARCLLVDSGGNVRWVSSQARQSTAPRRGVCTALITRTWSGIRVACRHIASSEIQPDSPHHVSNLPSNTPQPTYAPTYSKTSP